MTNNFYSHTAQGFGALAAGFVLESLSSIIIWIIVMGAVVTLDLIAGIGKSLKLKIKIKPSRFVRESIAKFTTYFAFVVTACMVQTATQNEYEIASKCCMAVITIEGISIFGNILQMKGYDVNFNKLMAVILSKKFAIDDSEGIITKSEPKNKHK